MTNDISINQLTKSKFKVKKSTIEWIAIIFLFVFSFINSITVIISLILLLVLLKQREIGALKIINLIALRTIINPGIAVGIEEWQNIKWIILFGCSIYLLFSYFKLPNNDSKKINVILLLVLIFSFYNIITAFVFSSLPTVASFKLISYIFVFMGTLIGIGYTYNKFNWVTWLLNMWKLLMLFSFLSIVMPSISYLRNGHSFQGITNQPNMFGITAVLFLALLLSYTHTYKINKIYLSIYSIVTLYMVLLSESRTAFISCLILLLLYSFFARINIILKVMVFHFSIALVLIILMTKNAIINYVFEFMYKGQEQGNLLFSRFNQIGDLTSNFLRNPWFGNGFAVPVLADRSYQFNADFVVEPGNLILSVLSYSGIIGFLLFSFYIIKIFWENKKNFKYNCFLPISAILISMGEMVFFSSNNIGIWCYMYLALYIFKDELNVKGE